MICHLQVSAQSSGSSFLRAPVWERCDEPEERESKGNFHFSRKHLLQPIIFWMDHDQWDHGILLASHRKVSNIHFTPNIDYMQWERLFQHFYSGVICVSSNAYGKCDISWFSVDSLTGATTVTTHFYYIPFTPPTLLELTHFPMLGWGSHKSCSVSP